LFVIVVSWTESRKNRAVTGLKTVFLDLSSIFIRHRRRRRRRRRHRRHHHHHHHYWYTNSASSSCHCTFSRVFPKDIPFFWCVTLPFDPSHSLASIPAESLAAFLGPFAGSCSC